MVRGRVGCYIRPLKVGGEEAVGFIEGGDGSRVEKLWRRNENVKGKRRFWMANECRRREGRVLLARK
jgi:hypothetical protein